MSIQRVRCLWQNWPGSPGYTNFYTSVSLSNVAPFATFFDAIKTLVPSALTITVPNSGDIINEATGQIQNVWTGTGGATITGTGSGAYAGPTGAVAEWLTTGIVAGRRVQGKTYLVPLAGLATDASGSISTTALGTLTTAAAGLQTALGNQFVVWSRPFEPDANRVPPDTRPARAGSSWPVIGSRVPDLSAVMRSRRS